MKDETNDEELRLCHERAAKVAAEQARAMRRLRAAVADGAELRALDEAAFALHSRLSPEDGGVTRILWGGWLEDWTDFYRAQDSAIRELDEPMSREGWARFEAHRRVFEALRRLFEVDGEIMARLTKPGTRARLRDGAIVLRTMAGFWREHGAALADLRASRRQLTAPYPRFEPGASPGATRH